MKKLLTLSIILIGLQGLLSSCKPGQQILQPGSTPQANIIEVIPTPSSGKVSVTGILKQVSGDGSEPVRNVPLALGTILENDQGTPVLGQLNTNSKLRTLTDDNGRFLFQDIPAGKYVLVFYRSVEAFMLNDPSTGGDLFIVANPDKIVDLGVLVYKELP